MKINVRKILFTSILIASLIVISIFCLIYGRGHTVYLDNTNIGGTSSSAYESIEVFYKDKKIVSLGDGDRGSFTLTGQKLDIKFITKKDDSSNKETIETTIDLPYNLDGIIINIPAYLDGTTEDVYMSEFVPVRAEEDIEEVPQTDEFGLMSEDE